MWIATSIATIVVGAVLRFGINHNVQNVNFNTIGLIIMLAGVAGLFLAVVGEFMRRHGSVSREVSGPDGQYIERRQHSL